MHPTLVSSPLSPFLCQNIGCSAPDWEADKSGRSQPAPSICKSMTIPIRQSSNVATMKTKLMRLFPRLLAAALLPAFVSPAFAAES